MAKSLLKTPFIFIMLLSTISQVIGQENYPIPKETPTRLFYIQHSNNFNTYVYDANIVNGSIVKESPIKEYRIVYTEGGEIKPLTGLQKRMAYGLTTSYISPNFYEMYLAVNKKTPFYLTLNSNLEPKVYITVNNRKMYISNIFVKLKDSFSLIYVEADYIIFKGTDFNTQKKVTEKYIMPN